MDALLKAIAKALLKTFNRTDRTITYPKQVSLYGTKCDGHCSWCLYRNGCVLWQEMVDATKIPKEWIATRSLSSGVATKFK